MPNKQLRRFHLERVIDDSGVSGTGTVALGVQFPSGRVCIEWCSDKTPVSANTIYQTVDEMLTVHGHEGHTKIVWGDPSRLSVIVAAAEPLAAFVRCWERQPLLGIDDEFYSIHTGTEHAASIRRSTLRRVCELLGLLEGND